MATRISVCLIFCFLSLVDMVSAQEESSDLELMLGLGVRYSLSPYKDIDADIYPVPIIIGEYKNFHSDGRTFGYRFIDQGIFGLSVVAKPRFMGYDPDDSSVLAGMEERDWSLDGGLGVSLETDYLDLDITGLGDLLNRHQGREVSAVVSKGFLEGLITPRAGLKWMNGSLLDYYYGVEQSEIATGRRDYDLSSELDLIFGITAGYPFAGNWLLGLDVEYEYLGSEIKDSPIVDRNNIYTYVASCIYKF